MPLPALRPSPRTLALWRSRLAAALRPALACALVACATLYGPHPLRRLLTFEAFSYVVAILVVSEATAGDALRGAVYGVYGSVQGVGPAILSLWAIGPARLSLATTTLSVSLSAFVVLLPGSTKSNILAKRVALGQIVLVYVVAYIHMQVARTEAILHLQPVEVAVSTGVGLLASVLAMLLPYPRLGYYQIWPFIHGWPISEYITICLSFTTSSLPLAWKSMSQRDDISNGDDPIYVIKQEDDRGGWARCVDKSAPRLGEWRVLLRVCKLKGKPSAEIRSYPRRLWPGATNFFSPRSSS
ncbi:hypothetical protein ACLOJK_012923 [Asimina triloba]